jgi:hypothetical protein
MAMSLNNTNLSIFVIEVGFAFYDVGTDVLYKTETNIGLQSIKRLTMIRRDSYHVTDCNNQTASTLGLRYIQGLSRSISNGNFPIGKEKQQHIC